METSSFSEMLFCFWNTAQWTKYRNNIIYTFSSDQTTCWLLGGGGDGSTVHTPLSIFCPFKNHTTLTEAMNVLWRK